MNITLTLRRRITANPGDYLDVVDHDVPQGFTLSFTSVCPRGVLPLMTPTQAYRLGLDPEIRLQLHLTNVLLAYDLDPNTFPQLTPSGISGIITIKLPGNLREHVAVTEPQMRLLRLVAGVEDTQDFLVFAWVTGP